MDNIREEWYRQQNSQLFNDNILSSKFNTHLLQDLEQARRDQTFLEASKICALTQRERAMMVLDQKDSELACAQLHHDAEADKLLTVIKHDEMTNNNLWYRYNEQQQLNTTLFHKVTMLEDEVARWKAKYESDIASQNVMVKRLQLLIEDERRKNEISAQSFARLSAPNFNEEKALRIRMLQLEHDNSRLKIELRELQERLKTAYSEYDNLGNDLQMAGLSNRKPTAKSIEVVDASRIRAARDGLKCENCGLRRELRDMKLSKEAMIFEHEGLNKDKEILRLRAIIAEYQRLENRKTPTYSKTIDDDNFIRIMQIVRKMNARFDNDLKKYLFAIWRLKFLLKRTIRLKSEKVAINFKGSIQNLPSTDNLMILFRMLRCSLAGKVFELFLRSKDEATKKKSESFILFRINLEEFLNNEDRLILLILKLYKDMQRMLGDRLAKPRRIAKLHAMTSDPENPIEVDDAESVNPYGVYDPDIRNSVNEWVEHSIFEVQRRFKTTGGSLVTKYTLTLFRFLAVYYKCLYPYSNKQSYRVDKDLFEYLETCVCGALANIITNNNLDDNDN